MICVCLQRQRGGALTDGSGRRAPILVVDAIENDVSLCGLAAWLFKNNKHQKHQRSLMKCRCLAPMFFKANVARPHLVACSYATLPFISRCTFRQKQIIAMPKERELSVKAADLCRTHGSSDATLGNWDAKYGGLEMWSINTPWP